MFLKKVCQGLEVPKTTWFGENVFEVFVLTGTRVFRGQHGRGIISPKLGVGGVSNRCISTKVIDMKTNMEVLGRLRPHFFAWRGTRYWCSYRYWTGRVKNIVNGILCAGATGQRVQWNPVGVPRHGEVTHRGGPLIPFQLLFHSGEPDVTEDTEGLDECAAKLLSSF